MIYAYLQIFDKLYSPHDHEGCSREPQHNMFYKLDSGSDSDSRSDSDSDARSDSDSDFEVERLSVNSPLHKSCEHVTCITCLQYS